MTRANKVLLADPYWNKKVEEQAIARAHRKGQTRPVQVYRYMIDDPDSIERNIFILQEKKEEHIESICSETARTVELPKLRLFYDHIQNQQQARAALTRERQAAQAVQQQAVQQQAVQQQAVQQHE